MSLAGLPLAGLRDRYRADIFDRYLPFMERHVVDNAFGGFMCAVLPDGTPVSTEKRSGYEGRGIWVYSFLYNNIAREDIYLETAKRSVDFLLKNKPRGASMWNASFSREGKPIAKPPASVNSDLYIADGLQEFAKASGDSSFYDLAREVLMKCLAVYDRDDYGRGIGQAYLGKTVSETPGVRILDDWMLFLWTATQMLKQKSDTDLLMVVSHCLETITYNFFNPETGLIHEMLMRDYSRYKNGLEQIVNVGNSIQTLWHVLAAAERINNRDQFSTAAERLKRHLEVSWDYVYGGLYNLCMNLDGNDWRLQKAHYTQAEALVGLLKIIDRTGETWACDWFGKIMEYERRTFHLENRGYSLWMTSTDRKGTFAFEKQTRIENFHQPRHLMLNLLTLEGLIERNGVPQAL